MNFKPNPDDPQQGDPKQGQSKQSASRQALANALEELIAQQGSAGLPVGSDQERVGPSPAGAGRCPQRAAWSLLLSGEAQPFEADELLAHAADCAACASLLRSLTADPTTEEIAAVSSFSTSFELWQQKLAVRLAATHHRATGAGLSRSSKIYLWGGLAVAATVLLAVGGLIAWREMNSPERLLAKAYSQSRAYEFRVPGAAFAAVAPQVHLRGGSSGRESAPLLEARAHIEKELETEPDDPRWLQLEARADILEEKFDAAIDILDRLLARGPVTSGLLADDATAYYQRGATTGSESDRSTALDYLRRADELTPGDPVVLFNEALAMEDRAQVMNAVETWNRYLRFERDPQWLAEGRRHLQSLEQKLNQLKTHQSRIDRYLATPDARRALAADPATLARFDEELANYQLPQLLNSAFPLPVDRSRGSPCDQECLSARTLIYALAASLQRNHQDSWLTELLPPPNSTPLPPFLHAASLLAAAVQEDQTGEFLPAQKHAEQATQAFHALRNVSGEVRSRVELAYSFTRHANIARCYQEAHAVTGKYPTFVWPMLFGLTQERICDSAPVSNLEDDPVYSHIADQARQHHYTLVELRARNMMGIAADDAGDSEAAWRIYSAVVRDFYSADLPAVRLFLALNGLVDAEAVTPRLRTPYLLQRETLAVLALTPAAETIPVLRYKLAALAIRAGQIPEAKQQMDMAKAELAASGAEKSLASMLLEEELTLAKTYLERGDLSSASAMLQQIHTRMQEQSSEYFQYHYAPLKGQLDLSLGHPEQSEADLREQLHNGESGRSMLGAPDIATAMNERPLYSVLAAVWLAQGRSGEDILALWERYRMRILGVPVPPCADKSLTCSKPALIRALAHLGADQVVGQIVLDDRLLLYRADAHGVVWKQIPVAKGDVMAAVELLERSVTSPSIPLPDIDKAAQKAGSLFLYDQDEPRLIEASYASGSPQAPHDPAAVGGHRQLLLEPDPMLGNIPWPAVEDASGPIGLHFNLSESPSLMLFASSAAGSSLTHGSNPSASRASTSAKPLIVGASIAANQPQALPEVMDEARAIAAFTSSPTLLLGSDATGAKVVAHLASAASIHFAGHAAEELGATRLLLAPSESTVEEATNARFEDRPATIVKSWLDSRLIRNHPPRDARLAVFSACSTGKKEAGWNHGMDDIVNALASVGVPDVVSTRWQIDSTSALPMMDSFYTGLANGQTVPQALTSARIALMSNPRYRHPYYWAAWYASGRGNATLTQIFHAPH